MGMLVLYSPQYSIKKRFHYENNKKLILFKIFSLYIYILKNNLKEEIQQHVLSKTANNNILLY